MCENVSPGWSNALLKVGKVTLCAIVSLFVKTTVSPTRAVTVAGWNDILMSDTLIEAGPDGSGEGEADSAGEGLITGDSVATTDGAEVDVGVADEKLERLSDGLASGLGVENSALPPK